MWLVLLVAMLVAGVIHAQVSKVQRPGRLAELCLIYMLAGYCGIAMITFGVAALFHGDHVAAHMHVPPGNATMIWTAFLLMGMGMTGTLSIWLRGTYLIAPVVSWAVFFLGATYAHYYTSVQSGHHASVMGVIWLFATHALISVLLVTFLLLSGTVTKRA